MAARMRTAWCGAIILAALFALPANAQQTQPLPTDKPPCCTTPQPGWYAQKKCPETADCMPGPDNARAERCAWVKANCPGTKIAY
jgi:hypothetical protein